MGADGHIQVFDWKKVKEKFPDAAEKLTSSLGYIQTMKTPDGKEYEVFSGYWGDNIYATWSDVGDIIAWGKSEEYKKRCSEIIKWMEENAQLFEWEVWT
jgi:hypothetical protein